MITETKIISAIVAIKSDAQVSVRGEDINQITWHDGNPTNITEEQILAKQVELQAEYDALDYARKRAAAYPSIYDYMDGIVKNDQAQIDKYIADSQAETAKYPKP